MGTVWLGNTFFSPDFFVNVGLNYLGPGYLLLWAKDCILETCKLFAFFVGYAISICPSTSPIIPWIGQGGSILLYITLWSYLSQPFFVLIVLMTVVRYDHILTTTAFKLPETQFLGPPNLYNKLKQMIISFFEESLMQKMIM